MLTDREIIDTLSRGYRDRADVAGPDVSRTAAAIRSRLKASRQRRAATVGGVSIALACLTAAIFVRAESPEPTSTVAGRSVERGAGTLPTGTTAPRSPTANPAADPGDPAQSQGTLRAQALEAFNARYRQSNFGVDNPPLFKVAAAEPGGGRAELWTAVGDNGAQCTAVFYSVAPMADDAGHSYQPWTQTACGSSRFTVGEAEGDRVRTAAEGHAAWAAISGRLGPDGRTVRVSDGRGHVKIFTPRAANGWFLLFVPDSWQQGPDSSVQILDANGRVVSPDSAGSAGSAGTGDATPRGHASASTSHASSPPAG